MKRVFIPEPHNIQLIDYEEPQAQAGEVLLKIKAVGICGSDLHVFEGQHPFVSYPVYPGHEVSGEIIAVGDGVDDSLIGKHAVIEPSIAKGSMPRFEPGRYNISSELAVMGFQTPGAMGELFAVAADRIHILPDDFSHDLGAMVEPTAVAVHGVRLVGNIAGMKVGVIGGGTIGLLTAQVARTYNAETVVVADLDEDRRHIANSLGLVSAEKLDEKAFDVVFECVGVEPAIRSAILACRKGATVVVMGVFGEDASIPVGLIQDWELRILGSLMYIGDDYKEAIRLLKHGHVRVQNIITHHFPLADVQKAFDTALGRGEVLKVVLTNA